MRWAVVTGGGRGIGAVVARHAVKEGYAVAVWDVDGDAAAASAADAGGGSEGVQVDVTDEASVEAAMAGLPEPPELVVNNAGRVRFGPLLELAAADWQSVLAVNLTGTFLTARAAARRMAERGSGVVVNVASINGLAAAPGAGAYTASKAAVVLLTEQMALEWAGLGIRVNAVAPGLIDAGMSEPIYADAAVRELRQSRVPLGRLGTADDVAAAVLYLGSDKASYLTGHTLVVDGGLTRTALAALPRPSDVGSVGVQR